MFQDTASQIYLAFLFLTVAFAWWKGGRAERIGALFNAILCIGAVAFQTATNKAYGPTPILIADGLLATGFLFGLFPALHSTRPDLITSIRAGAGQIAGGGVAGRFRTWLVVAQIALSTTLLVSAGLFLKSLVNVSRVDLGVRIDSVATTKIDAKKLPAAPACSGS